MSHLSLDTRVQLVRITFQQQLLVLNIVNRWNWSYFDRNKNHKLFSYVTYEIDIDENGCDYSMY